MYVFLERDLRERMFSSPANPKCLTPEVRRLVSVVRAKDEGNRLGSIVNATTRSKNAVSV